MDAFDELQRGLAQALAANRPGEDIEHALLVLPSYSVSDSGLAIDGHLGLTAIGMTPEVATRLHSSTEAVIDGISAQGSARGSG